MDFPISPVDERIRDHESMIPKKKKKGKVNEGRYRESGQKL